MVENESRTMDDRSLTGCASYNFSWAAVLPVIDRSGTGDRRIKYQEWGISWSKGSSVNHLQQRTDGADLA